MDCSILIPTLNSQEHLREVLSAALGSSAEIIVCDGGSTDGTLAIASSFGQSVRVVASEPGFATQLATGVREARGRAVTIIGADVLLPNGAIEVISAELLTDPGLALQVRRQAVPGPGLGRKVAGFMLDETFRPGRPTSVLSGCSAHHADQLRAALHLIRDCNAFDVDTCLAQAYDELRVTRRVVESVVVREFTVASLGDLIRQHLHYGAGDAHFYRRNRAAWTRRRRVQSLTHPFARYMVDLGGAALRHGRVAILPGLILCMAARYWGWLRAAVAGIETRPHWA